MQQHLAGVLLSSAVLICDWWRRVTWPQCSPLIGWSGAAPQPPWSGSIMSGQGGMPVASGGKAAEFHNTDIWHRYCHNLQYLHLQSVSKKMVFCGKTAITTFKLIQNAKSEGVLENSGYLLHYGNWDFQNWRRNAWENEAWSCQPPLQKSAEFIMLTLCTPLMILCILITFNESKICSKHW